MYEDRSRRERVRQMERRMIKERRKAHKAILPDLLARLNKEKFGSVLLRATPEDEEQYKEQLLSPPMIPKSEKLPD